MSRPSRPRASIYTLGCRLNQSETAIIADTLREAGYTLTPFGEPADLGIIHTCTVTAEADAKSRKMIRAFVRANPKAFLAVIGCYAELASLDLAEIAGVDLIIGNHRKLDVLDFVSDAKNAAPRIVRDPIASDEFAIDAPAGPDICRRMNLKIQDGCDSMCSYCIVPHARGRSRSRAIGNLVQEAERLAERGAREIVLTGVNVGAYNAGGRTLIDVIDRLNAIRGLARIRISSIEVSGVLEPFFERMNDAAHALVPHLHIPLQSGSDAILMLMNRVYTAAQFRAVVDRAAGAVADLGIGTDILVGFPGETEADFEATCHLLEESPIAYAHVFRYSPRPGTPSAEFPDTVQAPVLKHRSSAARHIASEKRRQFNESHIGRTMTVLFEREEEGRWTGYTGNYIRVAAPSESDITNRLCPVVLEKCVGTSVLGGIVSD
ncbi:MAG TPA: tRNA (N(6)-L-threonylcarbamoyladenosine(37)-C(2))-methylthiotransferase MtaB [Candidatus Hydrogenedentes bacterium]|nr:tRNA (N(6)-L-threonylcarbamoyladenosine(37)-C(2))-methylthiotransferase MtaB [Candidatus Hydrogenedentota bacterium]HPG70211.1 tRNA (N(6)-L-threonylcarbamoyladenosine(37)-C(2))-methylthiotransferase MtaB [Candidatus Hydrogenedentota bacterium]